MEEREQEGRGRRQSEVFEGMEAKQKEKEEKKKTGKEKYQDFKNNFCYL